MGHVKNFWKEVRKSKAPLMLSLALVLALTFSLVNLQVQSPLSPTILEVGGHQVILTIGPAEAHAAGPRVDFITDGIADDVEFQLALNALPTVGGKIVALAGHYSFVATVSRPINNVTIQGVGRATHFARNGVAPLFSAGTQTNWVFRDLSFDAGGVHVATATVWTKQNVLVGTTYVALQVPGDIEIFNPQPQLRFAEVDQIDPEGRWRYRIDGNMVHFERATAANWATFETWFTYDGTRGSITFHRDVHIRDTLVAGVQWHQSTDTWTRIDHTGAALGVFPFSFDNLRPWGHMRRVTLNAAGTVTAWGDGRGTGIPLDGSAGRVMVEIPRFWVRAANPSPNVYRWWISPLPLSGFEIHPAFVQRGGIARDFIYVGAYEAGFEYVGPDGAFNAARRVLQSQTGVQPMTGGQIWEVSFTAGANAPAIGNHLSTIGEAGWIVVDPLLESGLWNGTGVGRIWVRRPGDDTLGWSHGQVITNTTTATTLGTVNIMTALPLTISDARTLAGNIGTGWGIKNIWTRSAINLLFKIEFAGTDSQTLVGQGIVNRPTGIGFAGELTGVHGIDTNLATRGTGMGTGINGLTPIAYRGIENLWGNVWTFVDGYEARSSPDNYRIIRKDGTGIFANPMPTGSFETSIATPITTHGFIRNIVYEDLLKYLFIASDVTGSSTTFLRDYWWAHAPGQINIAISGGAWYYGATAGVGCRASNAVAACSSRIIGVRLEFIGN